jgi:hypothetical protein
MKCVMEKKANRKFMDFTIMKVFEIDHNATHKFLFAKVRTDI